MDEKNEGSKAEEERLAALAMDILSAKPQEHELVLEFDRLYKEFIDFANKENAMREEAKQIHKMQDVRKRLELVENFPFIYGKQIGAVGGGFSAGKSSFLNTFIKDKSIVLAVGVTPITVIPCYITCEDGSSITGYTEKGGRFSIEPETFKTISHEFLKSMNFDLKEHLPYISISSPLDKQLFSNICFIDTPGYDPAGISSDETDVDTAAEYILKADFLIWLINIESGCLMQTDIDFLNELAQKKDFAFYVVINKADLKPEDDSAAVLKRIQEDVEDRLDLKCSGISLYNSRKGKEYSFKGQSVTDFIKSHNTFVENKTYKEIETEIDEVLNAYMDALNNQKIEYEKDAKPIAEIEEHLKTAKELKGKFERGIILKLNERAAAQGHLGAQYKLGEMYYRGEGVKQDYQKAREWYEKAAAQGHLGAQCKLGEMYYRGEGVKQDYGKAVYLFEKAVERNYARAQFYLGAMYYKGKGASQDCAKAIYLFEKAAMQGHAAAQYNLGCMYYAGKGVYWDYEKAFYWLEKAAQQGYATAQNKLGYIYGIKQDYQKAFFWYEKAAKQGNAAAQFYLGAMYEDGEGGVNQDYQKASFWYEKAARQGDVNAQYNLGALYNNGEGVKQDYKRAFYWYEKAARQGDVNAQYNLGALYNNGEGVKQDYKRAFYWYEKAAEQEDADAQYNLGDMYNNGKGVNQDYQKASFWYEKAARQGDGDAQAKLGFMYCYGQGVKQDYKRAFYWYEKAAEQEDADAQYNLGDMYNTGKGVNQDYQKAREWYEKAAEQGYAKAQYRLGICYFIQGLQYRWEIGKGLLPQLQQVQQSPQCNQKAFFWIEKAAQQGLAEAQYNLGDMYNTGKGVNQDYQKAREWYEKAAEQGNEDAKKKLASL